MEIKNILYNDIDNALENTESEDTEAIKIDNSIVLTYAPIWHVTDRGILFVEGVWCEFNDETKEYEPDWSVTLIYDDSKDLDLSNYDYYEQGVPTTAIHNYLRIKNQI